MPGYLGSVRMYLDCTGDYFFSMTFNATACPVAGYLDLVKVPITNCVADGSGSYMKFGVQAAAATTPATTTGSATTASSATGAPTSAGKRLRLF